MNETNKFFFVQGFVHAKLMDQKGVIDDEVIVAMTELAIAYISKSGVEMAYANDTGEYPWT